jgi:uncharacterized protein YecT (DUF1311 family)
MINFSNIISSILFILISSGTTCQADDTPTDSTLTFPTSMIGSWQVTEVLTDHKDTAQGLDDKYMIPEYLGRIITLTSDRFSINTHYDDPCEKARLIPHTITASELISKSISTRLFSPTRPTPEDMQIPLPNDKPVEALYLSCDKKLRAKDQGMAPLADLTNVVWFIDLDSNKLAMSWHEQTVLILSRVMKYTKPVASFDCTKAGTNVEKAICNSVGLAAYDKSLSQTYKHARNYYRTQNDSEAVKELRGSQKAWLKQRDNCGADAKCLENAMSRRIGDIIYDLGDYMYQHR